MKIILASQSPRRKELLARLISAFEILPADIDETVKPEDMPVAYVEAMAEKKAALVGQEHSDALVIACDTIVAQGDKILGKPVSREEAFTMLQGLSDGTHMVYTAVVIRRGQQVEKVLTEAEVTFYPLTTDEINTYLDSGEYADKAGAYGIQEKAGVFVKAVNGDYYSIVGFPLGAVHQLLKKFN